MKDYIVKFKDYVSVDRFIKSMIDAQLVKRFPELRAVESSVLPDLLLYNVSDGLLAELKALAPEANFCPDFKQDLM